MCRLTFVVLVTLALTASAQQPDACEAEDKSCASGGDVLFQKELGVISGHLSAHEAAAEIFYDGVTTMAAALHQTDVNPTEMFISYDIASNGIDETSSSTHIFIPVFAPVQASFIRRFHADDDEEVGVLKHFFSPQPHGGAMSSGIRSGTAEKLHVLKRQKPVDNTAFDRANSHPASQLDTPTRIGMARQKIMLLTANALTAKFGMQTVLASGIPNAALRTASNGGDASGGNYSGLKTSLTNQLDELHQANQLGDPELSQVNCMHFEETIFDPAKGIGFPLNTKMAAYRGQTTSAPFTAQEFMQGSAYVKKEHGRLNIYFDASIHSHFPDPLDEDRADAEIKYGPDVLLASVNPIPRSPVAKYFFDMAHSMPKDYGALFLGSALLCDSQYKQVVEQMLQPVQKILVKIMMGTSEDHENQLFAQCVAAFAPCAENFLKPDHINGAEYGIYMAGVMIHAIMEFPPSQWFNAFARQDWNDYDQSTIRLSSR